MRSLFQKSPERIPPEPLYRRQQPDSLRCLQGKGPFGFFNLTPGFTMSAHVLILVRFNKVIRDPAVGIFTYKMTTKTVHSD